MVPVYPVYYIVPVMDNGNVVSLIYNGVNIVNVPVVKWIIEVGQPE
jgi:hypothetical protein